jgi:Cysteine rich repeat
MLKSILATGAIVLLSTTYTMAQHPVVAKECAADVRAMCGGVQPGEGRIRACLNSHLADLTAPCRAILVRAAAAARACRGDVRTLCGDVKPGGGRIEACLQSHLPQISAACRDVMVRAAARRD